MTQESLLLGAEYKAKGCEEHANTPTLAVSEEASLLGSVIYVVYH